MPRACSWSSPPAEITAHLWAKLSDLYDAPSDIDLFSAGLAETRLSGAHVGPTFACIIGRQVNYIIQIHFAMLDQINESPVEGFDKMVLLPL